MRIAVLLAGLCVPALVHAGVLVSQQPLAGGAGTGRWSQLWQDPSPAGNNLDGDSICWEDFTLSSPKKISHMEWWGNGASELGFRVEFWKQDPGTIAYQPLAVFDQTDGGNVTPEARFVVTPADYTTSAGPGSLTHFVLELTSPVSLAANDASNPRWFVGVIGLTQQAYYTWNWAQGTGGSSRTYQFVRGGYDGGGAAFRSLGEGRAMVIADAPEPGATGLLVAGAVLGLMRRRRGAGSHSKIADGF